MPAFLRFIVLVSVLSASLYAATFNYGKIEDESIKQPSRLTREDLRSHSTFKLSTPGFLHPGLLRSSKLKKQQIRAERIKRNMNTKTNASDLASTAAPTTIPKTCGETPISETNNTTSEQARGPCQASFLPWNRIPGQKGRNPCVKSIVRLYSANRKQIVTEFECHKASFYCPQTPEGMGRCQPIKVDYPALGRIITVGCKCHP